MKTPSKENTLLFLVKMIAEITNKATSEKEAIAKNQKYFLYLEYNKYSGYTLLNINVQNGGRKVFMQLGIEGDSVVNNDTIKRFVTIIDSNDGSTGLSIGIGDLTMSCQNQFYKFYKFYKKGDAKFRHTATLEQKLKTIPYLIETALKESLRQIEVYNKFVSTEVTKDLAHKMVKHLLGYDRVYTSIEEQSKKSTQSMNIMDKLYIHIEREMAQKGQNLWGLHSGVTSYTTHEISTPKRENARIESGLIGSGYKMNQNSLKFAELILA